MNFFERQREEFKQLVRGELPLWKVFWLYYVGGYVLLIQVLRILANLNILRVAPSEVIGSKMSMSVTYPTMLPLIVYPLVFYVIILRTTNAKWSPVLVSNIPLLHGCLHILAWVLVD